MQSSRSMGWKGKLPPCPDANARFTVPQFSPRLSCLKAVQQTDSHFELMFSALRSLPAFPTPLRQVIGQNWPWHSLARANLFSRRLRVVGRPLVDFGRLDALSPISKRLRFSSGREKSYKKLASSFANNRAP